MPRDGETDKALHLVSTSDKSIFCSIHSLAIPASMPHGMDVVLRKYGRCTSRIAPRTERQTWKKCDLAKHISRQNKENDENFNTTRHLTEPHLTPKPFAGPVHMLPDVETLATVQICT